MCHGDTTETMCFISDIMATLLPNISAIMANKCYVFHKLNIMF